MIIYLYLDNKNFYLLSKKIKINLKREGVLKSFFNYNVTEILIVSRKLYPNRIIVLEFVLIKYFPPKICSPLPLFLLNDLSDRYISNEHHVTETLAPYL